MMRFLRETIQQDDVTVPPGLRDEAELVASLKDMFEQVRRPLPAAGLLARPATPTTRAPSQIDVNGDATMEWDEFTSFIIDSGVSGPANDPVGVEQYLPSMWEDPHKHVGIIEQLYYWPECDMVSGCRLRQHHSGCPTVCAHHRAVHRRRSPPASAAAARCTCTGRRTWGLPSPSAERRGRFSRPPLSQRCEAIACAHDAPPPPLA